MLNSSHKYLPFWLFTISATIILVLSQLLQEGAFMDGMLYIAVSKNYALQHGTFWNPNLSQTFYKNFHEQPPLYFGLLGGLYKLLGFSIYVERLFCFVCYAANAYFIHHLWKAIFDNKTEEAKQSWLPILLWTTIPVCFWAYSNHVEETLMSVFTLASVYFAYKALFQNQQFLLNIVLAGVCIVLASLTKGIQGLFPLVVVGCYWLVSKNKSLPKMLLHSMLLIAVPTIIYVVLLFNTEVYESFKNYFNARLVSTFNNVGATTESHFHLLGVLIQELLPMIILTGLILFFNRKSKTLIDTEYRRIALWFVLIGFAGTLPLMVTLEQRNFYIVTALPFFAFAFAIVIAPFVTNFTEQLVRNRKRFNLVLAFGFMLMLASSVFTVFQIGKYKRHEELIKDVKLIATKVSPNAIIDMPINMANDWSTICYFIRYDDISLSFQDTTHPFFLIRKDLSKELVPKAFKKSSLITNEIDLYQR